MPTEGRVRSFVGRSSTLLTLYGLVVASVAFAFTHAALLVNDGHIYMEMARGMRHGSLEIANGLDVIDSPELWLTHSVKRGLHLYAKYPPFYGLVAAVPFALFGLRGLYLVNAAALALAFPAFYLLAQRILTPSRATLATLLLPVGTPIAAFALMELPHLLAMTLVLWAVVLWDESSVAASDGRAAWTGLAAGLLAGAAFGVRIQDLLLAIPLLAGSAFARRRGASFLATSAGFLACVGAVAAVNQVRFGSPSPFSYGPASGALGAPAVEETPGYFVHPGILALGAIGLASLLLARRAKTGAGAAGVLALAGLIVALASPVREAAARTLGTTASMIVNVSVTGDGWASPYTTNGWMNKALLVGAPLLALGLVGVLSSTARPAPRVQTALAWMILLLLAFLSQRDPDPRSGISVGSFFSLSPRYLVEVMPLLYLLAWSLLAKIRLGRVELAVGGLGGMALLVVLWASGPCDRSSAKVAILTNVPIALASLLVLATALSRRQVARRVSGPLVALAHGVAFACVVAEDGRALVGFGAVEERWGAQFLAATPGKLAIVGWQFAKDPIFHVRAVRDAVIVDASVDDAASLPDTLDALVAAGRTAVYFGWGIERCASLTGRYRAVRLLGEPAAFRLDPVTPDETRGLSSREPAPAGHGG